jgi:hypothetical protein
LLLELHLEAIKRLVTLGKKLRIIGVPRDTRLGRTQLPFTTINPG